MLVAIYMDRKHPSLARFDRDWFRNLSLGSTETTWDELELAGLFRLTGAADFVDQGGRVHKLVPEGGPKPLFAQDVLTLPPEELPGVDILFRIDDWVTRCLDAAGEE